MKTPSLSELRRYAVKRTLFAPTTLRKAIERLGFVQADPIRAPERAQDLILRHRVTGYRQGDLEQRYPRLPIDETFFINYGFLPHDVYALMHPRETRRRFDRRRAQDVLAFVSERGTAHPREVDAHFAHGTVVRILLGRPLQRDDASARALALRRADSSRATRQRRARSYGSVDAKEHPAPSRPASMRSSISSSASTRRFHCRA